MRFTWARKLTLSDIKSSGPERDGVIDLSKATIFRLHYQQIFDRMPKSADTRLCALLGDPVSHSLSPLIHNTAFAAAGVAMRYVAIRVRPPHLEEAVQAMRTLGFAGANLTIPHKEAVLPFVDELAPTAKAVGAVNTLIFSGEGENVRVVGENTDVAGFLSPLSPFMEQLSGSHVLVLGGGGAARAVVYAAAHSLKASRISVILRNPDRQNGFKSLLPTESPGIDFVPWDEQQAVVAGADLLVNATPLGMWPDVNSSPCRVPRALRSGQIVYDLVYNPSETLLLREATSAGATAVGGLAMLVGQAAASFTAWTEKPMPLDCVHEVLQERFRREQP
jgi:shikimate dehydrogenase